MPPKKKGIFKAIRVKAKSSRGGDDPAAFWAYLMDTESQMYENLLEQFQAASTEDKEEATKLLNELQDGFGDMFYESRAMADMGWSEGDTESRE